MRNRLAWIGGVAGGFALLRLLTRRRLGAPVTEPPPPDPRAEELRRRLDESRPIVAEREEFEQAETPVDAAVEDRRRDVHDRARETARRMRGASDGG
jgi:hypothetical protein